MAKPSRPHKAPMTLGLVVRVNSLLSSLGFTREDFAGVLNQFLPVNRQVKFTHSGMVKLNRWLNPSGPQWPEPQGEIALALQKSIEVLEKRQKNS